MIINKYVYSLASSLAFFLFSTFALSQTDRLEAGLAAMERGHYATAIRSWMPIAEDGVPEAQNNIGHMYEEGLGVPQNYILAMNWYRQAADNDLPEAQHNMGLLYYHGYGVAQNLVESFRWFKKAADEGLMESEYMVGLAYERGEGVSLDYAMAREYLLKAAKKNYSPAQLMYAFMLQAGEGGDSDSYNGYLWGRIAELNGEGEAVNVTSIAGIPLDKDEIDEANLIAERCISEGFEVCLN